MKTEAFCRLGLLATCLSLPVEVQEPSEGLSLLQVQARRRGAELGFSAVDGGKDRACRGLSVVDIDPRYYVESHALSVEHCKEICAAQAESCVGVAFKEGLGLCQLWQSPAWIGMTAAEPGSTCYRFKAAEPDTPAVAAIATVREADNATLFTGHDQHNHDAKKDGGKTKHDDRANDNDATKLGNSEKDKSTASTHVKRTTATPYQKDSSQVIKQRAEAVAVMQDIALQLETLADRDRRTIHHSHVHHSHFSHGNGAVGSLVSRVEQLVKIADKHSKTRLKEHHLTHVHDQDASNISTTNSSLGEPDLPKLSMADRAEVSKTIMAQITELGTALDKLLRPPTPEAPKEVKAFSEHTNYGFAGGDLLVDMMTPEEAKARCMNLEGCEAFEFQGESTSEPVEVRFKGKWAASGDGWTSFKLVVDDTIREAVRKAVQTLKDANAFPEEKEVTSHLSSSARSKEDESLLMLDDQVAKQASDSKFEAVDGGVDRACRGSSTTDSLAAYYDLSATDTLSDCQDLCLSANDCRGVEFNAEFSMCQVWTRVQGIEHSAAAQGYQCYRLKPAQLALTQVSEEIQARPRVSPLAGALSEVSDAWHRLNSTTLGFEPASPELIEDAMCAGSDAGDASWRALQAPSLLHCKLLCAGDDHCSGISYQQSDGVCKVFGRPEDVKFAVASPGSVCLRFLGIGASYEVHQDYGFAGGDLSVETIAAPLARGRCASMPSCVGFSYQGNPTDAAENGVEIRFKGAWLETGSGWTTYHMNPAMWQTSEKLVSEAQPSPYDIANISSRLLTEVAKLGANVLNARPPEVPASQFAAASTPPQLTSEEIAAMVEEVLANVSLAAYRHANDATDVTPVAASKAEIETSKKFAESTQETMKGLRQEIENVMEIARIEAPTETTKMHKEDTKPSESVQLAQVDPQAKRDQNGYPSEAKIHVLEARLKAAKQANKLEAEQTEAARQADIKKVTLLRQVESLNDSLQGTDLVKSALESAQVQKHKSFKKTLDEKLVSAGKRAEVHSMLSKVVA